MSDVVVISWPEDRENALALGGRGAVALPRRDRGRPAAADRLPRGWGAPAQATSAISAVRLKALE